MAVRRQRYKELWLQEQEIAQNAQARAEAFLYELRRLRNLLASQGMVAIQDAEAKAGRLKDTPLEFTPLGFECAKAYFKTNARYNTSEEAELVAPELLLYTWRGRKMLVRS